MAKTVYSTSSSDRCEAQNKLTCPHHGVAGDFTEVPKHVSDNVDRQRSLDEDYQDKRATYLEYAKELGIKPINIDRVIQGVHPTTASEDQVDGLINVYNEYTEAAQAADEESEQRSREVSGFLDQRIKEVFPEATPKQREMVKVLVGLRFAGIESDLNYEADPTTAGELEGFYRESAAQRGWNHGELFAIARGAMNKPRLRELDRSYFTALSGRIPSEADLDRVEHARRIRRSGPIRDKQASQEAWELGIRLSSID
jgi:hypothetical protein